jgi:hypothetical protein
LKVPPTDVGAAGLEVEVEEGAEMSEVVGEPVEDGAGMSEGVGEPVDEGIERMEILTVLEVGTESGEDVVLGTNVEKTGALVIGVIIALELGGELLDIVEVRSILVDVAAAEEHHALSKAITVLAT